MTGIRQTIHLIEDEEIVLNNIFKEMRIQQNRVDNGVLSLDKGEAISVQDYLTIELAKHGFDKEYSINEVGKTIESLIDKIQNAF